MTTKRDADVGNPESDDAQDALLIKRVREGNRDALEHLIKRHQQWVFNIARRMLYYVEDAEDATQEILIKVVTKLSTFHGDSGFRTWMYRVTVNHLLNVRRGRWETGRITFERYGRQLDATPDLELGDPSALDAVERLIVEETQISCTSGMLLCLDREQRMVYILGQILGVPDVVGGEILDISRVNFRQKLARARRDLHAFMNAKCGLVNPANPCRCHRKTNAFIRAGFVNPDSLRFARERVARIHEVAPIVAKDLAVLDRAYGEIFRNHPFYDGPDFVASLRRLLERPEVRSVIDAMR